MTFDSSYDLMRISRSQLDLILALIKKILKLITNKIKQDKNIHSILGVKQLQYPRIGKLYIYYKQSSKSFAINQIFSVSLDMYNWADVLYL